MPGRWAGGGDVVFELPSLSPPRDPTIRQVCDTSGLVVPNIGMVHKIVHCLCRYDRLRPQNVATSTTWSARGSELEKLEKLGKLGKGQHKANCCGGGKGI